MAEETQGMTATFEDYAPPAAAAPAPKAEPAVKAEVSAPEPEVEVADAPAAETSSDPVESKARELGWKPLQEYGGDPRKWVEARVWVENKPLVDQVRAHKQTVREQQKTIEALNRHYKQVHETAYRKALSDLDQQKEKAVLEQDVDKVRALDQQIAQTQSEQIKTQPVVQSTVDPAYTDWISANQQIRGDAELWTFACAYEAQLSSTRPDLDLEARLEKVEAATRKAHPEKFANPRRQQPPMMEGAAMSAPGNGKKSFGVNDLTPLERQTMARLVRNGTLTQDEYVRDIKESREGNIYTIGD
jgi:hypothetical protein